MRYLISATCLALALTACGGSDDGPAPDGEGSLGDGLPKCADIIKVGETLPEDYEGCADDNGGAVADSVYDDCADGRELVKLTYNEEQGLAAFLGESIGDDFDAKFAECYPS